MEHVAEIAALTALEVSCVRLCAEGKTDAEIGAKFDLTCFEVGSHFSTVLLKLHAPNRLTALTRAMRLGLLTKSAA